MKGYEIMYIAKPDSNIEEVVKKYEDVIVSNGGEIVKIAIWGKKRLAYEIQELSEGQYVLTTFNATPAIIQELDRQMRIDQDTILRHMIISLGE